MPKALTLDDQRKRAHAWRAFVEVNGRQPGNKPNAPQSESALYYWIHRHRKGDREGTLDPEIRAVLDEVAPGWQEPNDPSRPNPALHSRHASDYLAFVVEHGHVPRQNARAKRERQLQHWMSNQRATLAAGQLQPAVHAAIRAVLPGWDDPSGRSPREQWTVTPFADRLRDLEDYLSANRGLLPPASGDGPDASIGRWLRQQRALLVRGELKRARKRVLDDLAPGWSSERRSDQKWTLRLGELTAFVAEHGYFPRHTRKDDAERALHSWLQKARKDDLSDEQIAALDNAVAGWRGGAVREVWAARVREIQSFVAEHGHRPRPQSVDPAESRMGYWLTRQRKARKNGTLSLVAAALLSDALPGWETPDKGAGARRGPRARPLQQEPEPRLRREPAPRPRERDLPPLSTDDTIDRALRDVTNRYPVLPWDDPFEYAHRVVRRYLRLAARTSAVEIHAIDVAGGADA